MELDSFTEGQMTVHTIHIAKSMEFMELHKYFTNRTDRSVSGLYSDTNNNILFALSKGETTTNAWVRLFSPIYGEFPSEYRFTDVQWKYRRTNEGHAKRLWSKALKSQAREEYAWNSEKMVYLITGNVLQYLKLIMESSYYDDSIHVCEIHFSDVNLIGLRVSSNI